MDEKENQSPGHVGENDAQWKHDAKSAGEDAGRAASLQGELDPKKVADSGKKAGADAAWKGGGDSQKGGEIGQVSALETWGDDLKNRAIEDVATARENLRKRHGVKEDPQS